MRLISFQIKNYCSIIDTGTIELSEHDNVLVLAGQNESGKSSILKALNDFDRGEFEEDSLRFSIYEKPIQEVCCKYKIENNDILLELITNEIKRIYNLQIAEDIKILDEHKINHLKEFTLTMTNEDEQLNFAIDLNTFNIFLSSILNKPKQQVEGEEGTIAEKEEEKYIEVSDNDNEKIADIFWQITPKIIFFDDFCDLLPDEIFISKLKNKETNTKGYHAVKNFEKILNIDFIEKDKEGDAVRETKQKQDSDELSINFQNTWGQKIHDETKVDLRYSFQKRNGQGEDGSYVNFYVKTKENEPLPPKKRSKGLIWFLSLWLELEAQKASHRNLILLLDEPDQHLHVKAQKDILKLINKLSSNKKNEKGAQIIYATHSPHLIEVENLNRVKLILNIKEQGTKIEDISTCKIDTDYKKDALQPVAIAIGINPGEFSTFSDKNVILEGLSDFFYFSGMKKLLNRVGDYHFIPGIGVRQINNLISLCIGYCLDWIVVIDDDPKKGGKESKKKFNEIKDFIFDGEEAKTKEKVYILKDIIGIENMFIHEDLRLIDENIVKKKDKSESVGEKRKVIFSKLFLGKVESEKITKDNLSKTAIKNFNKVFDFIDRYFNNKEEV